MANGGFERCVGGVLIALSAGFLAAMSAMAEVPQRSEGGQTLVVPEKYLDMGEVYYVQTGEDTQIVATSEAPLQRLVAVSNRVVGFVVTPFDIEDGKAPVLAGAFRLPARSIRTHSQSVDEILHGGAIAGMGAGGGAGQTFLTADKYPELLFEFSSAGVKDVVAESKEGEPTTYRMTITGEATIKGVKRQLVMPVEVTFLPFTWGTMSRNVGDLLRVTAEFELDLADVGPKSIPRQFAGKLTDKIDIDLFLMLGTVTPDKTLDPSVPSRQHVRELRFLTLLRDLDDPDAAYDFGRTYLDEFKDDVRAHRELARIVATEDGIERRDFKFALGAAKRACTLSKKGDPQVLATLALVYYEMSDPASAVTWQRQAVEALGDAPPYVAAPIRQKLAFYEAEAKKTPAKQNAAESPKADEAKPSIDD